VDGTLLQDLAVVSIAAALAVFVCNRLRLPVIFGYLLAGLVLSTAPFGMHWVEHAPTLRELSQLGVLFLMFFVGLQFNLRRVQRAFVPVLLATTLQTAAAFFLGIQCAPLLGFNQMEGFFLGGILSNSATLVAVKVLVDRERIQHTEAQLMMGILILEDIVGIMLLVVLSGASVSGYFDWGDVFSTTFLVGVFVVALFYLGRLAMPMLDAPLRRARPEMLVLVAFALVLGIGQVAGLLKFSASLGAFLTGAILSQCSAADELDRLTQPFKDLFSAIFFITVGMLIDPAYLLENWMAIGLLGGGVVLLKLFACWLGLFLGGQSPELSLRASLPKATVGEFAFIIAAFGASTGVTRPELISFTVGIALVSILLVPLLNWNPERLFDILRERTPQKFHMAGRVYTRIIHAIDVRVNRHALYKLSRRSLGFSLLYFALLSGVLLAAFFGAGNVESSESLRSNADWIQVLVWLVAAAVSLPFLVALVRNLDVVVMMLTESTLSTVTRDDQLRGRMRNLFNTIIHCLVILGFGGLYLSVAAPFFPSGVALGLFFALVAGALVFTWSKLNRLNSQLEFLFIQGLNEDARDVVQRRRDTILREVALKYPWKVQVAEFPVVDHSQAAGRTLAQLDLRSRFGVSVAGIQRGTWALYDPNPHTPLFPGEKLLILGTEKALEKAGKELAEQDPKANARLTRATTFRLEQVFIGGLSPLIGETLAGASLRSKYGISVLGIQRGGDRITSPPAEELLLEGDVLYIVGAEKAIKDFREEMGGV